MFERSKVDGAGVDTSGVSVSLTTTDGVERKGRLAVPQGRSVTDVLNGTVQFVEFEEFDGPRTYLAKHSIGSVCMIAPSRGQSLPRMRNSDGFDPYGILGLPLGARPDEIRAAYLAKAKAYHPDRFANADLPDEVKRYLEEMTRRVNAAFAALQSSPRPEQQRPAPQRVMPIYSSPTR